MRIAVALVVALLAMPAAALPGVRVQGALSASSGTPVDGTYTLTARVFAAETGGSPLHAQVFDGVVVQGGLFDVLLAVPPGIFRANDPTWLEVAVDAEPPLPRQRVTSAAYALHAESAGSADQATVALGVACSGCVGAGELAAGSVSSGHVTFNWAASATKGGAAADLACSGCVGTADIADGAVGHAQVNIPYAGSTAKNGPASNLQCTKCVSGSEVDDNPTFNGVVKSTGGLSACSSNASGCAIDIGYDGGIYDHNNGFLTLQTTQGLRVRNIGNTAWAPVELGALTVNGATSLGGDVTLAEGAKLRFAATDSDVAWLSEATAPNDNLIDVRLTLGDDKSDQERFSIYAGALCCGLQEESMHWFTAAGNAFHKSNLQVGGAVSVGGSVTVTGDLTVSGSIIGQASQDTIIPHGKKLQFASQDNDFGWFVEATGPMDDKFDLRLVLSDNGSDDERFSIWAVAPGVDRYVHWFTAAGNAYHAGGLGVDGNVTVGGGLRVDGAGERVRFTKRPVDLLDWGALEVGATGTWTAGEINGVIGFPGYGVQHGQVAFAPGSGFYLCNSSSKTPSGNYGLCSSRVNLYAGAGDFNAGLKVTGDLMGAARESGSGKALKVCAGGTPKGATSWIQYPGGAGIYVSVPMSCGFTQPPYVTTSLHGDTSHWTTTGGSEPYNVTATGFGAYIYGMGSPANANAWGWRIHWIAVGE